MEITEALDYFKYIGEIARSEPDRELRLRFLKSLRENAAYQEAFTTLRLSQEGEKGGQTMKGLIAQITNRPGVLPRKIGETSYGLPILEFMANGETQTIVPVRAANLGEDMREGAFITAQRAALTNTSGWGHFPIVFNSQES